MQELIRSNDIVLLSYIRSVLEGAGIFMLVADEAMSSVEGSLGVLPRRVLVAAADAGEARRLLLGAGIDQTLLVKSVP